MAHHHVHTVGAHGAGNIQFPWECRDKEDLARTAYNQKLRTSNQSLSDENMKLKKLLRENSISWSPIAHAHLRSTSSKSRKTRSSMTSADLGRPFLPMEVILKILGYALQSPAPIIDPLSRLTPHHLTEQEKTRGNQVAIHFLATCKALNVEGTRLFWERNEFVFTSPQAVRSFCEVDAKFRNRVTHVTFRIVARYYDDQKRSHKLDRNYHSDLAKLKKDPRLAVQARPKETPLARGGFRCYTWNQVVDFLLALRAPYDPAFKDKTVPRPRLLPSLTCLRLDLVNFCETILPFSGSELHEIASHELGCTLDELQVTGMPFDDAGMKASAELSGMLKDEGLYLDGPASFIAHAKHVQPLSGASWCARVIRAWKDGDEEIFDDLDDEEDHLFPFEQNHSRLGALPPAPKQEGHPTTTRDPACVIWRKVPTSRDSKDREWTQFSRFSGYELSEPGIDSDDEGTCPCCGEHHPVNSSDEYDSEF